MVDCAEFLDLYSDYRDGCLPDTEMRGFEDHLKTCVSCARYDRVVGGGIDVFRTLPQLTPSPDFQERLRDRIWYVDRTAERRASGASLPVTLVISFAIAASAWLPTVRGDDEPVTLPAVMAHAPYHDFTPVLMRTTAPRSAAMDPLPTDLLYTQGLLLDRTLSSRTVALRPASALYSAYAPR